MTGAQICTIEGCTRPLRARGWCATHWARWHKHGTTELRQFSPLCSVEGCSKASRSLRAEMCETHYYRLRRNGTLALTKPQRPRREECTVDGCAILDDGPHGLCGKHLARLQRNGDPLVLRGPNPSRGPDNPNWTGDDATSKAVHQRIHKARGKAKCWQCTDCAKPAEHWSYDHTDPDEKFDTEKGPYSIDINRYFPRCVRCHKRFDMDYLKSVRAL